MEKLTTFRYPAWLVLVNDKGRERFIVGDLYISQRENRKFSFLYVSNEENKKGFHTYVEQVRRGDGYRTEDDAMDAALEWGVRQREEMPDAM